jgi:hypothetical protein
MEEHTTPHKRYTIKERKEYNRNRLFKPYNFWRQKKESQRRGNLVHYSISNKLKRELKITEEFEVIFNNLSLEEVIGLKLELASRNINGKLYDLPLWNTLIEIVKEAVLKYAYSASRTKLHLSHFLGVSRNYLDMVLWKYNIGNYFACLDKKKDENL